MKKCVKCGEIKEFDKFYSHPLSKDGYAPVCINCSREYALNRYNRLKNDPDFRKTMRERKRIRTEKNGYEKYYSNEKRKEVNREQYKKFPEKRKAYMATHNLLRKEGCDLHYKDYIELSKKDHKKAHRFIIYDQERMMYRSLSGELLDNKDRHLVYIEEMIKTKDD